MLSHTISLASVSFSLDSGLDFADLADQIGTVY
jgi:hypothetical protein